MSREVDRVLAERTRRSGHGPEAKSFLVAMALHGLLLALVLLLPRLKPPPQPLEFVPVQIIPALLGYNYFTQRIRRIRARLEDFILEFLNLAERNFT